MAMISIVLPVYNGEQYIRQSLDSILQQTFTDWELIVVDDCSTDATPSILREYEKSDQRISIYRNASNQNLPQSLNIGFLKARGEYLTWTSDDNLYSPRALEAMYRHLSSSRHCPMVCAKMKIIDEYDAVTGEQEIYSKELQMLTNCVGACFLYRRSVYEKIGQYDPEMLYVEDYDYWIRIMEQVGQIEPIDEFLYFYRWHGGSLSTTKREMVKRQLSKLRERHLNFLLPRLSKTYMCKMALEESSPYMLENIYKHIPEVRHANEITTSEKKIIIFGSGNYGAKALGLLKDQAVFFVDNDIRKVGGFKAGLEIISCKKMQEIYREYTIMIAVDSLKVYEIVQQLLEAGIEEFCIYQKFANRT